MLLTWLTYKTPDEIDYVKEMDSWKSKHCKLQHNIIGTKSLELSTKQHQLHLATSQIWRLLEINHPLNDMWFPLYSKFLMI